MLQVLNKFALIDITRVEINILKRAFDCTPSTQFMLSDDLHTKGIKLLYGKKTEEKGRTMLNSPSSEYFVKMERDFSIFHASLNSSRYTEDLKDKVTIKVWDKDADVYVKILEYYAKKFEFDQFEIKNCGDSIREGETHQQDFDTLLEGMKETQQVMKAHRVSRMDWG